MLKSKESPSQGIMHNALSQGTIVRGNVSSEADMRIDGVVEGNIECKGKIVLGPKGAVKGNINCENAELMGKIEGDIYVHGVIALKRTSVIVGEMTVQSLDIEPGAIFNGSCKMITATSEKKS